MTKISELTRPIVGMENRTAQEVFDIMADRFRHLDKEQESGHIHVSVSQSSPQPAGVRVKGLGQWRRGYCDDQVTIEQASFGGLYQVRVLNGVVNLDWPDRSPTTVFATVDEAKAAAEADYRQRILSALETQEGEEEAVAVAFNDQLLERIAKECADAESAQIGGWRFKSDHLSFSAMGAILTALQSLRKWRYDADFNAAYWEELGDDAAHPAPVQKEEEGQTVSGGMTAEQHRLESLKQMARYDGPIVSFEFREPYYLASCDNCGWVGSSELCGADSFGDDSDVYCPRCSASGADCGKVAETLTAALVKP